VQRAAAGPVRSGLRVPAVGRDPAEGSTDVGHRDAPVLCPRPSQDRNARDRTELGVLVVAGPRIGDRDLGRHLEQIPGEPRAHPYLIRGWPPDALVCGPGRGPRAGRRRHRARRNLGHDTRGGRPPERAAGRHVSGPSAREALIGRQGQFTVCEDRRGRPIDRQ